MGLTAHRVIEGQTPLGETKRLTRERLRHQWRREKTRLQRDVFSCASARQTDGFFRVKSSSYNVLED